MSSSNSPVPQSHSASPAPGGANRHALTPVERQRSQLERLLKDPSKPAYVPPPAKEKTIRPPREMMKNVQGSSAGAGSGEFHVYKASRRREYERLRMMEEAARQEVETTEFERRKKESEDLAEAKTAKNRARRQKKKDRARTKTSEKSGADAGGEGPSAAGAPLKKRRLVNGKELVFRKPGDESSDEEAGEPDSEAQGLDAPSGDEPNLQPAKEAVRISSEQRIIIHEDD